MNNRIDKISTIQAIFLLVILRLLTTFTYLPSITSPPKNQDIWISELLSLPYTVIIALPILYLSKVFNDLTPIQYSEKILGRTFGKLIGIFYIAFFLFNCILFISLTKRFFGAAIMPETPPYAIAILMIVTGTYAVYKGIATLARAGEVFAPVIMLVILIFIALGIGNMDFTILLPVFADSNLVDINIGAFTVASRYTDIIMLCMLVPDLSTKKDIKRVFIAVILIACIFFILITIAVQTTLGLTYSSQAEFPFFTYTRTVDVFDFIQRVESVNVMAWVICSILKYSTYLYFAALGVKHVFGMKSQKPVIIPIALLTYVLSFLLPTKKSVITDKILSYEIFPFITLAFFMGIPLFLLIAYAFRKKILRKGNDLKEEAD